MTLPIVLWENEVSMLEEDCACPQPPSSSNLLPAFLGKAYESIDGLYVVPLWCDFQLAYNPAGVFGPAVLNRAAQRHLQRFKTPQILHEKVDEQLAAAQLIMPIDQPAQPMFGPPDTLTAWMHITNACNLDCPYCYVRKSSAQMLEEVGLAAIESLFRSAQDNGFHTVKLKYAGGEAFLHFKLIQKMHAHAQILARSAGVSLRAVVLSNGVAIAPYMVDWLLANDVKLMVSIDGVGETHDRQRPTRSGGGSFTRIEKTVDQILLPRGLKPDICITLTKQNASAAADMMGWVRARDLPFSLNFYRNTALPKSPDDFALEEKAIVTGLKAAYAILEKNLPTRPFLSGLLDRTQAHAHTHTCGVGQSYVVITHTGMVAQCQMHLEKPMGRVGEKDPLRLVANGPLLNLNVDEKDGCRDCTWRYRCAGGCPLETYRATGRFDVKSPHCSIYTALFPYALRLEGLRLLKVGGYLT